MSKAVRWRRRRKTRRAAGGGGGDVAAAAHSMFFCPLCRGVLEAPVTAACGHTACRRCLGGGGKFAAASGCAVCGGEEEVAAAAAATPPSTDILVQDIVAKWRDRCARACTVRLGLPYCLRSQCDGLHGPEHGSLFLDSKPGPVLAAADLECVLCGQCLLDPVTTTCGHTFCRACLARVLDHGLACPLCVSPLGPGELQRGENALIERAVRLYACEERLLAESGAATLDPNNRIPIFICTNAFPQVACPLFVYEPKYRLLARRCIGGGGGPRRRRFGMAARTPGGGDRFALFGTLLEIRDSVGLSDGTSIVTTIGLRRFRVLSRGEQDGYDTATVRYIRDARAASAEGLRDLHARVHAKTLRWLRTLEPRLLDEIERCIGPMPAPEKDWPAMADGPAWTWWLVAVLPLGVQLRVGFLASTSLEKRLLAVEKMLDHLKIRARTVEGAIERRHAEDAGDSCASADILRLSSS